MATTSRPNILFIHADQHRWDCVGANGHPLLKTPHLDGLAAAGINFSHAFTPIPLCTPARNCLMHGCWPWQHQVIANYDTEAPRPAPDNLPAYSELLAACFNIASGAFFGWSSGTVVAVAIAALVVLLASGLVLFVAGRVGAVVVA